MTSRQSDEKKQDRTIEDSFPASDPPASTGITGPRTEDSGNARRFPERETIPGTRDGPEASLDGARSAA
jgi:hypothetical protein